MARETGMGKAPWVLVVMGVSGCGKSTVGERVAARLGGDFLEGDSYHSPANIAKMAAGIPLEDADRFPWLDRLGTAAGEAATRDGCSVVSCSALKRSYRDRLRAMAGCPMLFALLDVDVAELRARIAHRPGHYMPVSLLDSQLATLEAPGADERAMRFAPGQGPDELATRVLRWVEAEAATG